MSNPRIENAKHILAIILPIPEDKFITDVFGYEDGTSCFLGHIHRALSPIGSTDFFGDFDGYGARDLTAEFLLKKHGLKGVNGANVNNDSDINGYTEPVIKDRLVHMVKDMIEAGY